ncbi:MAG: type II toxin-antitoxin system RelE/ParE family toxin [Treponema sp.]|jgi:toxin ParE1/3/4|nr:type II toxin-antitoxin system RelE/ParE family toxin [Treponema sp.]
MKHEIIWSKDAGDELAEIISYIKYNTGKMTAEKIYKKIINKVNQISENPEGRRIAPLLKEFGINYIHQLNVSPWIIFYKVVNKKMEIISIIDGRRNLEEILYRKMMDGKIT